MAHVNNAACAYEIDFKPVTMTLQEVEIHVLFACFKLENWGKMSVSTAKDPAVQPSMRQCYKQEVRQCIFSHRKTGEKTIKYTSNQHLCFNVMQWGATQSPVITETAVLTPLICTHNQSPWPATEALNWTVSTLIEKGIFLAFSQSDLKVRGSFSCVSRFLQSSNCFLI